MANAFEPWYGGDAGRQWRALAERRRQHLVELYRSGRWRRYFTEEEFLHSVRQASAEVEGWARFAAGEISLHQNAG